MSALAFQKAMAQLIRYPNESLSDLEARFGAMELTVRERGQLERMSFDPLVRKFGRKMKYCRQRDAMVVMNLSRDFIAADDLNLMYQDYFEPSRTSTDLLMIGVHFLEFLRTDSRCQEIIARHEPFLKDLINYDHVKALTIRQVLYFNDESLPLNSLLQHQAFTIQDFEYDVTSLDRLKVKEPGVKKVPDKKPMKLIFLRSLTDPFYRIFQIDSAIEAFLVAQREAPEHWEKPLPEAYGAMVRVGLCKPLT